MYVLHIHLSFCTTLERIRWTGFDAPFGLGKLTNPGAVPGDDEHEITFDEDLYNKFKFDVDLNPQFPIEDFKDQIIEMIEANPAVLMGETSSRKSTQVAQYILEHHMNVKHYCNIHNIVCTQPRRIAATSIAKYVCWNRELGSLVGYQIGMDKITGEKSGVLQFFSGGSHKRKGRS